MEYLGDRLGAEPPDALIEEGPVDRDDLRRIRHGVPREARGPGGNKDVPRCICPREIARERDANDCRETTPIQVVPLHHHDRAPEARA